MPAVLLLAAGGVFLGRASISTDEAATWINSAQPISAIVRNSAHIDVMFLPYYLFMHLWLGVSQSLWWMRLPSLIAGVVTVEALILLALRWLPVMYSVLAGFLLALNPLFVEWSMLARPYTAATLFAVMSTAALVTAIGRGGLSSWLRYGLAAACMALLHLLAIVVLVPQFAAVAAARRRSAWVGMVITVACLGVILSPLAAVAAGETGQIAWIAAPSLQTFPHALGSLSGGRVEGVVLVFCCIVLAVTIASSAPGSKSRFSSVLCLAWGTLPAMLLIAISFLHPVYVDRYALVSVPGIALTQAMAAWRVWMTVTARRRSGHVASWETKTAAAPTSVRHHGGRRRWVHVVATITCATACVVGLALLAGSSQVFRQRYVFDDYRSAAAALSRDLTERPSPVLLVPQWAGVGFSYYAFPAALSRALAVQETQALNQHLLAWQPLPAGPGTGTSLRHISILSWPVVAPPKNPSAACAVGWAIGRGTPPGRSFTLDGSSCRLSRVHYYGLVWVASAGG